MNDTIAAIATAPGEGGIAIVRLSGADSETLVRQLFRPANGRWPLTSHMLTYGTAVDAAGAEVDECMTVLMRAPRSYTREDVAELQLHGGSWAAQRMLDACIALGARNAEPGEFTRRAFENGRIDLSEAEAVMSLISSRGEQSAQAALRQLSGGTSAFIRDASDELYRLTAGLEAAIDYPEEVDEGEATAELLQGLRQVAQRLESACDERAARILQNGLNVALCGRPNVGKSSLLNALLGEDRAIVTPIAGTTRDVVTGTLTLGGTPIHLSDTAGLHAAADTVEQLGIRRAEQTLMQADLALLTLDAAQPLTQEDTVLLTRDFPCAVLILLNKSDLPAQLTEADVHALVSHEVMQVSAAAPETLEPLKERLASLARVANDLPLTQQRHMTAARRAAASLREAAETLESGTPLDLTAVDIRNAIAALGEITGDQVEERVLDEVFGRFCVGK